MNARDRFFLLVAAVIGFFSASARADLTNSVTPNGLSGYFINGTNNATLILYRGITYVFSVNASGHPFFIKTNATTGTGDVYTNGVTGNGVQIGTLSFVVPAAGPNQLFYHCSVHSLMGGILNISNAPAPPSGAIVFISVSQTGVTMKSIGATNWNAAPEFRSNLVAGGWASVPNFTNVLANGTNTTTFNRLDAICGSNVFLRVRNTFP